MQGIPAADEASYRRCLAQYGTGVAVMTVDSERGALGVTANSFASVSLRPPLILWSIQRNSSHWAAFTGCRYFAVNVLGADQAPLSSRFARSQPDKFRGIGWRPGIGGSPLIDSCVAQFECRLVRRHDEGDHGVLIGEVERFHRSGDGDALLFVQGRFTKPASLDGDVASAEVPRTRSGDDDGAESVSSLVARAYGGLSSILASAREREKLSQMETRILRGIYMHPGMTLPQLLPMLLLGVNAAHDVVSSLQRRNLLTVGSDGTLHLTDAGKQSFLTLIEHTRQLEERQLDGISGADLAIARNVLLRISQTTKPVTEGEHRETV